MAGIVEKELSFQFTLGEGQFGETGSNTTTVKGLRASVEIDQPGGVTMATGSMKIYGMTKAMMDQLSTLGQIVTTVRKNTISVMAGDVGATLSTVFDGTIFNAYGDYNQAPNVPFVVDASSGFFNAIAPTPSTVLKGAVPVTTMLRNLATTMGARFEGNGVTATLTNAHYYGSAWRQAAAIVHDAGLEWNGAFNNVLAVWNPGESRGGAVPIVQPPPDGGMIGYPSFFPLGIQVRNTYDPAFVFGRPIQVKSSLKGASGKWIVAGIHHSLESQSPGGKWETLMKAAPVGYGPIVPSS